MRSALLIVVIAIYSHAFAQNTCEDNCGSGTLEEYLNGEIDCLCNLECAGYGPACCDYYDVCFMNPTGLTFNDFIGQWNGRIMSENFGGYNDSIIIEFSGENLYSMIYNPGGHLEPENYPGTEEVYYDTVTNILNFRWIYLYHYGMPFYTNVPFQVMSFDNGDITLFYNNGSGPAPQARSMFLSSSSWEPPYDQHDLNQDGSVTMSDAIVLITNILNEVNSLEADFNFDLNLNIFDLILLIDYITDM